MSKPLIVITGAGSGIGRALAVHAAKANCQVLGIGRRHKPLLETQAYLPAAIEIVAADITLDADRNKIINKLAARPVTFLVHNAAILDPVAKLADITAQDWLKHQDINVNAALFLTQALLPHFASNARILSISSGAAHSAYPGWTAYCTSKAALAMLTACLDIELKDRGIRAGSAAPGVVDTPMQDHVRTSDPEAFPNLQRFIDLKNNQDLTAPAETARFLWWLLSESEADAFAQTDWDIRQHWQK